MMKKGFTLLETVIAFTLLALVLIPFYSFVGKSFKGFMKTADKVEKIAATEHAITFLKSINPTDEPQGMMDFGHFTIEFDSHELLPPVPAFIQAPLPSENKTSSENETSKKGQSKRKVPTKKPAVQKVPSKPADITLYTTHVRLYRKDDLWFEFDVRQIGYKAPQKDDLVLGTQIDAQGGSDDASSEDDDEKTSSKDDISSSDKESDEASSGGAS